MKTTRDGLLFGVAGGFAATVVIDVVTAAVMPLMGLPAIGGFSVTGDTAAGFFRMTGLSVAGGVPLGILLHCLIGAAVIRLLDRDARDLGDGLGRDGRLRAAPGTRGRSAARTAGFPQPALRR